MTRGWTAERRAKQAKAIMQWKPWTRSTGSRTSAGKARASRNAYRDGHRLLLRQLARGLKLMEETMAVHARCHWGAARTSKRCEGMLIARSVRMSIDNQHQESSDHRDRGEGQMRPAAERNGEGVRDESSDESVVTDTDVANAADEAGSAFLPHDKVLSNPDKQK